MKDKDLIWVLNANALKVATWSDPFLDATKLKTTLYLIAPMHYLKVQEIHFSLTDYTSFNYASLLITHLTPPFGFGGDYNITNQTLNLQEVIKLCKPYIDKSFYYL